jgi:hypothetical protein
MVNEFRQVLNYNRSHAISDFALEVILLPEANIANSNVQLWRFKSFLS